jgi:hypothetical protein
MPENETQIELKQPKECRICKNYLFDRDIEVTLFSCSAGFFNFEETSDGNVGKLPIKGTAGGEDMPCEGSFFTLDVNSKWYRRPKPGSQT